MKIIIVGKSASGKDFFKKLLSKKGLKLDISYTTRKRKDNESDGVDYQFVTASEFDILVERKRMVQWQEFNGNKYGTHHDMWKECDVFIMNANGISQLSKELREQAFVCYLNIHEHDRYVRILDRDYKMSLNEFNDKVEANDKEALSIADIIHKRIEADKAEYKHFTDYDIEVVNPDLINPALIRSMINTKNKE